jgi:hypothetical protein
MPPVRKHAEAPPPPPSGRLQLSQPKPESSQPLMPGPPTPPVAPTCPGVPSVPAPPLPGEAVTLTSSMSFELTTTIAIELAPAAASVLRTDSVSSAVGSWIDIIVTAGEAPTISVVTAGLRAHVASKPP